MKNKIKKYIFWIKSSRGTDTKEIVPLSDNLTKSAIKDSLEDWCSGFGAWHVSENIIEYGFMSCTKTNLKRFNEWEKYRETHRQMIKKWCHNEISQKEFNSWRIRKKKWMKGVWA